MPARPLLALLVGLLAAFLLSGGAAAASHAHPAHDGVQMDDAGREHVPDRGCCTAEGAHCASPTGIVSGAAVNGPTDNRVPGEPPPDRSRMAANIPDPQPKPPRA